MKRILEGLEPKSVFKYFEEISQIPRGSGNEKEISDYLVAFAKKHNLSVIQDKALNVIIKKDGTPGYENAPGVILQGHMDMVCEKNKDTEHDFLKDPINLKVKDDFVYAEGTTLGADNGIAVAYALALLSSKDIPHPPLEVVVTTNEETGLEGAAALDTSLLKGKILINLDSEEEGEFLVSCAGGGRAHIVLKPEWIKEKVKGPVYSIQIRNLKGGHSGQDINKGRGNANKMMGRILLDIKDNIDFKLISINGGAKDNVIPREIDTIIQVKKENEEDLIKKIKEWDDLFKKEYKTSDSDVTVKIELVREITEEYLSEDTKNKIISILSLIPNGVQTMSMDMEGLVESSTNLGVVITDKDKIEFISAVRSSVKTRKYDIMARIKTLADLVGADYFTRGEYPAWQYTKESKIRDLCIQVYEEMYGKKPVINAIHAGVECGFFAEKMKDIDIISLGPNMWDVHTPNERLSISSTKRVWEFLINVLKRIK
ncbi:aminoacyl-histidine dipeptidase [Defluviitalea phaphyphila]|uniref:aminoacyl-histidine dipeptidase n=1 Tax=Defluviitalea phaphyphila TaxID=1473580 RepID=UPI00073150D7|nr:aminoacyl-histidine dipeptidase [Defluviitalea phaphyphila]